jgi:hypothetical protein
MFVTTLAGTSRARTPAISTRFRARRDVFGALLLLVFATLTTALFFAWLSSWNTRSPVAATSPPADCTSLGRGGPSCAGPSATGGRPTGQAYSGSDCVSAGRGGLICGAHPAR